VPTKEWPWIGRNRQATVQYLMALRRLVGLRADLRRGLVRCCACGIRFLSHPCNDGRADLRCPFGCREHHARTESNKRSVAYYQTEDGRNRKRALNATRSPHSARGKTGRDPTVEAPSAVVVTDTPSGPLRVALGPPGLVRVDVKPMPLTPAVVAWADSQSARSAARRTDGSAPTTPAAKNAGSTPSTPTGLPLSAAASGWLIVTPLVVEYLCETFGRVERRSVGAAEVLNLLERLVRQRSLGRRVKPWQDAPPPCTSPP
jgi:hypothetical protein